jgi:hypothetical protein
MEAKNNQHANLTKEMDKSHIKGILRRVFYPAFYEIIKNASNFESIIKFSYFFQFLNCTFVMLFMTEWISWTLPLSKQLKNVLLYTNTDYISNHSDYSEIRLTVVLIYFGIQSITFFLLIVYAFKIVPGIIKKKCLSVLTFLLLFVNPAITFLGYLSFLTNILCNSKSRIFACFTSDLFIFWILSLFGLVFQILIKVISLKFLCVNVHFLKYPLIGKSKRVSIIIELERLVICLFHSIDSFNGSSLYLMLILVLTYGLKFYWRLYSPPFYNFSMNQFTLFLDSMIFGFATANISLYVGTASRLDSNYVLYYIILSLLFAYYSTVIFSKLFQKSIICDYERIKDDNQFVLQISKMITLIQNYKDISEMRIKLWNIFNKHKQECQISLCLCHDIRLTDLLNFLNSETTERILYSFIVEKINSYIDNNMQIDLEIISTSILILKLKRLNTAGFRISQIKSKKINFDQNFSIYILE